MCLGLHPRGWWAAGAGASPAHQVGQEGTKLCSSSLPLPRWYPHQQSADMMGFQPKHADTRGDFCLNSSRLSIGPGTLQ